MRALVVLGVAAALAARPASACTPPPGFGAHQRIESPHFIVLYRTLPPAVAVGDHFAVEAVVCPKDATPSPTAVQVDAYMPEHRHGMNSRARTVETAPGRYRAEGLMLHMPGRWELRFDVDRAGARERLSHDIELP